MTPLEIKFAIIKESGSLVEAARKLSDEDYAFGADQLSRVIHKKRTTGSATAIIQKRVARLIGKPVGKVFGETSRTLARAKRAGKN